MSDNVYTVKPREILGIDQEENADNYPITSAQELQICLYDRDKTYIHFLSECANYVEFMQKEMLQAYRLGVDMERDRIVESFEEWSEVTMYDGDAVKQFIDWHLGA